MHWRPAGVKKVWGVHLHKRKELSNIRCQFPATRALAAILWGTHHTLVMCCHLLVFRQQQLPTFLIFIGSTEATLALPSGPFFWSNRARHDAGVSWRTALQSSPLLQRTQEAAVGESVFSSLPSPSGSTLHSLSKPLQDSHCPRLEHSTSEWNLLNKSAYCQSSSALWGIETVREAQSPQSKEVGKIKSKKQRRITDVSHTQALGTRKANVKLAPTLLFPLIYFKKQTEDIQELGTVEILLVQMSCRKEKQVWNKTDLTADCWWTTSLAVPQGTCTTPERDICLIQALLH